MGDPRVERTRTAVLDASAELLADAGVVGFSVDAVARRSGVARTTIYRHWPDANQLLFDTFAGIGDATEVVETGDLETDLVAVYGHLADAMQAEGWGRMLPAMLDACFRDPTMRPLLQEFTRARRQPARDIIRRAVRRGDLPAGTDVERLIDRIAGPIFYRFLVLQDPYSRREVATLVGDVLAGYCKTVAVDMRSLTTRDEPPGCIVTP
jgi:AcrR family transcriptional regulator